MAGATRSVNPSPGAYRQRLAGAKDYGPLASELLAAARAGDADAQYYLSHMLEGCAADESVFFQRRSRPLGIDEALSQAAQRHLSLQVVQARYERCHALWGEDRARFGTPQAWLAQASAAGQPVAEAVTAREILVQQALKAMAASAGVPPNLPPYELDPGLDPRALLRDAVESRQPEVLFEIGGLQQLLNPSESDPDVEPTSRIAWWLLACQRGFDCSRSGEWFENGCGLYTACMETDGEDSLRAAAGELWPEVQARASQILSDMNAGRWDELGLGRKSASP